MGAYYDEIEIEDMVWDAEKRVYHYPCPCGDRFEISRKQLRDYEDIATCPSCSLVIRVVYDPLDFEDDPDEDEDEGGGEQEEEDEDEGEDEERDEEKDREDEKAIKEALEKLSVKEVSRAVAIAA